VLCFELGRTIFLLCFERSMRSVSEQAPVFVFTGVMDMRMGVDRLAETIRTFQLKPTDGSYYVFFSRQRNRVRIFYWEADGYALWTKRLEAGAYRVEKRDGVERLTAVDLYALLSGTDFSRLRLKKSVEQGLYSAG